MYIFNMDKYKNKGMDDRDSTAFGELSQCPNGISYRGVVNGIALMGSSLLRHRDCGHELPEGEGIEENVRA